MSKNNLEVEDGKLGADCTYYEKAILAASRSRITADQLVQWLREGSEGGVSFEQMMAELLGSSQAAR